MKNLSAKWQKLIIWLTGYVNIVAFILGGGYVFLKTEDKDVKKSAKIALVVVAIFTAIDLVFTFLGYIFGLANVSYAASEGLNLARYAFLIFKPIAFATLFLLDFFGVLSKISISANNEEKEEKKEETNDVE